MNHDYNHPSFSQLLDSDEWLAIDQNCPFADVLGYQGLLTDQLKIIAKEHLTVECVSQNFNDAHTAQRRDVALLVDNQARVLASTIIPEAVLKECPTLLTLGNCPIGEHLEENYSAKRSVSKYQQVASSDLLNDNFTDQGTCYLRKYDYLLKSGNVTIVELFSPGILTRLDSIRNH